MSPRPTTERPLRVALSKGRIFDETLPLFAAAGIRPTEDPSTSRRLILPSEVDVRSSGPTDGPTDDPPTTRSTGPRPAAPSSSSSCARATCRPTCGTAAPISA